MPEHKKREASVDFEIVKTHHDPSSSEPGKIEMKDPETKEVGLEEVRRLRRSSGGLFEPGKENMAEAQAPSRSSIEHENREAMVNQEVQFEITKHPHRSSLEPVKLVIKDPEVVKELGLEEVKWLRRYSGGMADSQTQTPVGSSNKPEEKLPPFEKTVEKVEDIFENMKKTRMGQSSKKDSKSEEENKKAPDEALDSGQQQTMHATDSIKNETEHSFLEKAADTIGDSFNYFLGQM